MTLICQSIIQSTCPRSFLTPLQAGQVLVALEHKYGHCELMDMLNKLYNCSSYSGANKYRANATFVQWIDLLEEVTRSFLQYQADNIDHASRTIDGYSSVHIMGQIATFTSSDSSRSPSQASFRRLSATGRSPVI